MYFIGTTLTVVSLDWLNWFFFFNLEREVFSLFWFVFLLPILMLLLLLLLYQSIIFILGLTWNFVWRRTRIKYYKKSFNCFLFKKFSSCFCFEKCLSLCLNLSIFSQLLSPSTWMSLLSGINRLENSIVQ